MGKMKRDNKESLNKLLDSVIDDIKEMPDDEVMGLATDTFGGIEQVVTRFNSIVEYAENKAKKIRLERAQRKIRETKETSHASNIVNLPMDRKKQVLEMAQRNGSISTLAARNLTDNEADIDSMLEDLFELGVIDENGNSL